MSDLKSLLEQAHMAGYNSCCDRDSSYSVAQEYASQAIKNYSQWIEIKSAEDLPECNQLDTDGDMYGDWFLIAYWQFNEYKIPVIARPFKQNGFEQSWNLNVDQGAVVDWDDVTHYMPIQLPEVE